MLSAALTGLEAALTGSFVHVQHAGVHAGRGTDRSGDLTKEGRVST